MCTLRNQADRAPFNNIVFDGLLFFGLFVFELVDFWNLGVSERYEIL